MKTNFKVGERVKWITSHLNLRTMKRSPDYWETGVIYRIDHKRKRLAVLPDAWRLDGKVEGQGVLRMPSECVAA